MPKVSIITTTFNRKDSLRKCIECIQKQSFEDYEHIIIDDCSTDDTQEVVKDYQENPKIRYYKRDTNFGNDTRPKNEAIALSQGDYIAFCDDDVCFRPDHLALLVKEMEKYPEYDGVYGQRMTHTSQGSKLGTTADYSTDGTMLFGQNFIDTSDVLIKKSCLYDMGGFDERYKKFIDWNLWVRMWKANKRLKYVPIIITDYYLGEDSKSMRKEDSLGERIPAWHPLTCEVRLDYLGAKPEPKVAVFSLTYNRLDYTKKCFESMYKTANYPFMHFIVDNGSTDGTKEWLSNLQLTRGGTFIIDNFDNKGISIASNQALDEIKTILNFDIIAKVDNDCYFKSDGWLSKIVEVYKIFPRLITSLYVEGLVDNPGGAPRLDYMEVGKELVGITKHIGGICCFADAQVYKDFRWEETDFLHGMQDTEFSQWASLQGYMMGYLENYFCEHIDGTNKQKEKYPEYFEKRKEEKHTRYEKNRQ